MKVVDAVAARDAARAERAEGAGWREAAVMGHPRNKLAPRDTSRAARAIGLQAPAGQAFDLEAADEATARGVVALKDALTAIIAHLHTLLGRYASHTTGVIIHFSES